MTENKYLPIGFTIAKKYEIVDVLGEDDFEILYLVRDVQRKGSFFVLKELFLETFSSREGELVFTQPEALGVFHKRKKQIIEEINTPKSNINPDKIKVYGYEDENNTIYTIMEFSSDASLEKYLQFSPKGDAKLPNLNELASEEKKSFNTSGLIKILLFVGIGLGVAFYGYQFFQKKSSEKKSETLEHPVLKERIKKEVVALPKKEQTPQKEEKQIAKPVVNLPVVDANENNKSIVVTDENISKVDEENSTLKTQIVEEEVVIDNNEMNNSNESEMSSSSKVEESMSKEEDSVTEILLPHITPPAVAGGSNEANNKIKNFLDAYIEASATSVNESLKFYAKHLRRYFRFRNATHKTITQSQKRYNKKWVKRNFKVLNFKVLKSYKRGKINYFNIKTTTLWKVSNRKGKKRSGKSRGFMIIKEVGDSFKITSIHTLK